MVWTGMSLVDPESRPLVDEVRVTALLDLARGAVSRRDEVPVPDAVVYDVYADAVVARVGTAVVGAASLAESGDSTIVVSPAWRRKGIGRALLVLVAGVARHAGRQELVLLAPADDAGTLPLVATVGLHPRVRLRDGLLQLRIGLRDVRPVPPSMHPGQVPGVLPGAVPVVPPDPRPRAEGDGAA